jgi:tripartite-type tricarboxylate transporter receptor subunit TctC
MWIRSLIALAWLAVAMTGSQAQSYPSKPVYIVVPVAAGGVTDTVARAIAQRLAESWGQPVLVENKPGAGTQIGAEYVAKSAPDGHTLLLAEKSTFVINPTFYSKLAYDPMKDFAPITGLVSVNMALIVHKSVPAKSVSELVALAKAKPGQLNYATYGLGSSGHLDGELFQIMAGVKLVPVHYRGATPALSDVIAGHVPMLFITLGSALQAWKAGHVNALAVGKSRRLPMFPDLPTISESGVPGFESSSWFGLVAPQGTPRAVVAKINADVQRIFNDPAFRERFLAPAMYDPITSSPEDFAATMRSELQKWGKVIRDANLKAN